jgi:hypothetical protein
MNSFVSTIFEWLSRRKIILCFVSLGINNLVFTLFSNLMLLAIVYLVEVGLTTFFNFYGLNNILNLITIFLFGVFLFILCLLIIIFAVVEYHDCNIDTCKE